MSLDRLEELLGRRVHRLAPVDDSCCAHALEQAPVALACDDRHDRRLQLLVQARLGREPILTLGGLDVHVPDLDALDHAERRPGPQRGTGVVGVHVGLERARIAHDEQRVSEGRELSLERG